MAHAIKAPAAAPTTTSHAPIWRSVAALADALNGGSKVQTFTVHALRHYVRFADQNGLAPHVRRIGSKILIDETGFRSWIDAQGQRAA
ncbi:hypothetical protein [uncultured Thiodictyon sp.]|uniref:hypothetical protein n=1 Tax=uncultured Thiodictyon sp. TaxID=1846217 RepID=UPI0025F6EFEC|nr:hypothetical protein [uncultured Thiodictyon sp.]